MKITLEELRERIQKHFQWDIEISDSEPNRLLIWHPINWSAPNEKDYKKQEKLIDRQRYKSKLFEAYAWYDISGYDYWVKQMSEPNYVSIDVVVSKPMLTEKEVKRIINKLAAFDDNLIKLDSYTYGEEL